MSSRAYKDMGEWARELGITPEQLQHALAQVGGYAPKVKRYVRLNPHRFDGSTPERAVQREPIR